MGHEGEGGGQKVSKEVRGRVLEDSAHDSRDPEEPGEHEEADC